MRFPESDTRVSARKHPQKKPQEPASAVTSATESLAVASAVRHSSVIPAGHHAEPIRLISSNIRQPAEGLGTERRDDISDSVKSTHLRHKGRAAAEKRAVKVGQPPARSHQPLPSSRAAGRQHDYPDRNADNWPRAQTRSRAEQSTGWVAESRQRQRQPSAQGANQQSQPAQWVTPCSRRRCNLPGKGEERGNDSAPP